MHMAYSLNFLADLLAFAVYRLYRSFEMLKASLRNFLLLHTGNIHVCPAKQDFYEQYSNYFMESRLLAASAGLPDF